MNSSVKDAFYFTQYDCINRAECERVSTSHSIYTAWADGSIFYYPIWLHFIIIYRFFWSLITHYIDSIIQINAYHTKC